MATTYRVLSDLLYRSVATVTTANVVTEAYDTDAYGNTLCYSGPGTDDEWFTDDDVQTNNPINTTIFTGRQYDPESLIYWYRARYYNPQIGRFLSRDPLKDAELTQGPNLYRYVRNNAPDAVDPTGMLLDWIPILGALEQALDTWLGSVPGMNVTDYAAAAGDGIDPACTTNITNAELGFIAGAIVPNAPRYVEDAILDAAVLLGPEFIALPIVGGIGSVLDIIVGLWATFKIDKAGTAAIAKYCHPAEACNNSKGPKYA